MGSVFALVGFPALARAQDPAIACKKTETQPECFARLKCKASEELDDCQKRLQKCTASEPLEACEKGTGAKPTNEGNAGQRDDGRNKGGDRDANERGRDREPDNERGQRRDRDERDRDRDRERGEGHDRDEGEDRHRQRGARGPTKGFQANKTFGLGLELGEPAGLNGKYFVSKSGALDFGIGWIYGHYYYGDGLHIYADYLWHPTSLVSASAFELPFYVGAGLRYWAFDYCDRGVCTYRGSAIGIRIPIGISFDFNRVPLDIFIQIVPVIDFVNGDYYDRYNDRSHFGVDLSAGIRYWFK